MNEVYTDMESRMEGASAWRSFADLREFIQSFPESRMKQELLLGIEKSQVNGYEITDIVLGPYY